MGLCWLTKCIRGVVAQVSDESHGPLGFLGFFVTKNFMLFMSGT